MRLKVGGMTEPCRIPRQSRDELENLDVASDRKLLRENSRILLAPQHHSAGTAGVRRPGKVDAYDVDSRHGPLSRYRTARLTGPHLRCEW